jgi:hypothetical protein
MASRGTKPPPTDVQRVAAGNVALALALARRHDDAAAAAPAIFRIAQGKRGRRAASLLL